MLNFVQSLTILFTKIINMNLTLTRQSLLILFLSVYAEATFAQTNKYNPITTAVPYLRLAADPKAGAMGDMGVATAPDANSIFYNPGKTAFNQKQYGAAISYTPYLQDLDVKSIYLLSAAGFYKLDENQAISLGFRYFSQGDINVTDALGQDLKTYKPSDMSVEAGYSRKLSKVLAIGINARYIHSKLGDNSTYADIKSGNAFAVDLGGYYTGKKGFDFGLAFTNIGSKIGYTGDSKDKFFLPANISLGTSYKKKINADNGITFGLQIDKLLVPTPPDPNDATAVAKYNDKSVIGSLFSSYGDAPGGFKEELKEFQLGLGAEYAYKEKFMVRAGYFSENKDKGYRNYVTTGLGLIYKVAEINFSYLIATGAYSNSNGLKNTFRLGLVFNSKK